MNVNECMRKAQTQVNSPRTPTATGPQFVAIVDDDSAVCNSLKFALELEGFQVRTYGSGAEILRDGDLDDFDCFVVDQRMPAMTGFDLILKLRELRGDAPAILIVSQHNQALSQRAAQAKVPIVEKPFLGNALVERIREVCAADRAGPR